MSSLKNSYNRSVQDQPREVFVRKLTIDGERDSLSDMNVDGSIIPVEFWTKPTLNRMATVENVILSISDTGQPAITDYGNITGGLQNGVQFFIDIGGPGGTRILFRPILHRNDDIVETATLVDTNLYANNERILTYQKRYYTFSDGLVLDGRRGDTIGAIIQDDCTPLTHHHINIEGFQIVAKV